MPNLILNCLGNSSLKKRHYCILFILFTLFSSASFASFSTHNTTEPYNFIEDTGLTNFFDINGTQFFSNIDTAISKEKILKYETLQPKIIKPSKIPAHQTIWIINNGWTSTIIQQGNSIITLKTID